MSTPPYDRVMERRLILGWTFLGGLIRAWNFPRLGLNHFDEGIYAVAAMWLQHPPRDGPFIDPGAMLYSPPLFPGLISLTYFLLGTSDRAALLVSWLAGTLTIPLAAMLARRGIGLGAGGAVAALAAFSGPHIVFSRMALTDATFLMVWLLALGLGAWFLDRPRFGRAIVFGVSVGLAQLVKYNGWLTGVIPALACSIGLFSQSPDIQRRSKIALAWGCLAAAVAALVYLPWFRFVEFHGGYGALLKHHRGYVDGPFLWPENWRIQMAQTIALGGIRFGPVTGGALAWLSAWLSVAACQQGGLRTALAAYEPRLGLILGTLALGVMPEVPWWIGLAALPSLLASQDNSARIRGVWWLSMSLLTPLYHPYARLWLPMIGIGWFAAGTLMTQIVPVREDDRGTKHNRAAWIFGGAALAHLLLFAGLWPWPGLFGPTDGVRIATRSFVKEAFPEGSRGYDPSAFIMSRPSAVFYLHDAGIRPRRVDRLSEVDALSKLGIPMLLDEAQAPGWSPSSLSVRAIEIGRDSLPAATHLDIEPSASLREYRGPREVRFWGTIPNSRSASITRSVKAKAESDVSPAAYPNRSN
jgi:dolichyl-phosphate-mannose-protein mannosyltransferase